MRSGLSILTLATPVWFGNEANDPVKYVFCLSAADKADHLLVMRSFVAILEDKHFFEVMDTAKTGGEIVQYMVNQHGQCRDAHNGKPVLGKAALVRAHAHVDAGIFGRYEHQ